MHTLVEKLSFKTNRQTEKRKREEVRRERKIEREGGCLFPSSFLCTSFRLSEVFLKVMVHGFRLERNRSAMVPLFARPPNSSAVSNGYLARRLALLSPVSVYCDRLRSQVRAATSISVWQQVVLFKQTGP